MSNVFDKLLEKLGLKDDGKSPYGIAACRSAILAVKEADARGEVRLPTPRCDAVVANYDKVNGR